MKRTLAALATVAALGCTVNAHAGGIPVIDVAAIAQMVEQMVYLKGQLDQMKSLYNSTIGSRGLGGLINNPQARSYLPSDVNGVLTTVQTGKSGDLVGLARQILGQNSVLNTKQLGALSGNNQTKINDQRGQAAAQSAAAQRNVQLPPEPTAAATTAPREYPKFVDYTACATFNSPDMFLHTFHRIICTIYIICTQNRKRWEVYPD